MEVVIKSNLNHCPDWPSHRYFFSCLGMPEDYANDCEISRQPPILRALVLFVTFVLLKGEVKRNVLFVYPEAPKSLILLVNLKP